MEEYNNYFKIPGYYTKITSNIHSEHLLPIFTENPIEYLRGLYSNDNEQFYNVRDELILRGVGFQLNYQNDYLLDQQYNIEYIISKEYNTNAFKDINFSLIGASNLTERFNIKSDRFFHGVPLEGVLYFTRGISTIVLQDMFKMAGFSIIPVEDFVFQQKNEENEEHTKEKSTHYAINQESSILNNPPPQNTTIDYLFDGTDYKTFRIYCKENNIKYFYQLTIDFVKNFEYQKDIRGNTAKKVFTLYRHINEQFFNIHSQMEKTMNLLLDNSFKRLMENTDFNYQEFINEFYSANSEEFYNNIYPFEKVKGLEEHIITRIFENEAKRNKEEFSEIISEIKEHPSFTYIEDLTLSQIENMLYLSMEVAEDKSMLLIECFDDIKYMEMLKSVYNQLRKIKPISVNLEMIMDQFSSRDLKILYLRQTKTLEEIGGMIGVTRERVRQIQSKATDGLSKYKNKTYLELYINHYSKEENRLLSVEEFMNYYKLEGDMYNVLLHLFFEMEDKITYVDALDIYIETDEYTYITEILNELELDTPIISVQDIKQYFPSSTEMLSMEVADLLLRVNNYQRVNNIYVKEAISMVARINYLFEHIIIGPLEMDEKGYLYFKELMNSTFDIPYDSNKRAATSRIADGEDVVLVDRNTFAYHKKETITNAFLYELEGIMDEQLEKNSYVDPRSIYKQYDRLMEQAELISPAHLYSIVQIYLDEKYETAIGNTLYIYKVNTEKVDDESILLNYLIEHGHEVNKDLALKDLKWKWHKLDGLLLRIKTVILIKNNQLKTIESFNFQQKDLNMLAKEVKETMNHGYVFTQDLKFELGFNENFPLLIKKYNLLNDTTLIAILKWLLPDLQGHSKLLYRKDNPITKLEQVVTHEYPDILARRELIHFIENKGYSIQTFDQVVSRILEEEYFYHYTTTQYINTNQLNFSEEVKESLATYLTNELKENDYMSVYNMVGFTNKILSISEYQWTEWLIYQFAKYIGYKQVSFTDDSRHDRLILVKEAIKIDEFDELVLHIVETEYGNRRYHEEDLARFLEAKKLLNNPRKLPSAIHQSPYFKFDSFGFFEVRSCDDVIN